VAVNPREATAEEITRFTREYQAENVAIIESDRAEVLEIEISEESVLVDRPIRESVADLPDGVVIGAIARDRKLSFPGATPSSSVGTTWSCSSKSAR
jgi:trk system potassium uptake protein TrkA